MGGIERLLRRHTILIDPLHTYVSDPCIRTDTTYFWARALFWVRLIVHSSIIQVMGNRWIDYLIEISYSCGERVLWKEDAGCDSKLIAMEDIIIKLLEEKHPGSIPRCLFGAF